MGPPSLGIVSGWRFRVEGLVFFFCGFLRRWGPYKDPRDMV